ncbi:MAG: hypothetical protein H6744_05540 [Deltaproteobacteria bacterium]|nr:hypothetical protein [Deltaproteobacteria bacterium]MCB9786142.1 hypothetical protein [Deltaproteobacteria bacterium]
MRALGCLLMTLLLAGPAFAVGEHRRGVPRAPGTTALRAATRAPMPTPDTLDVYAHKHWRLNRGGGALPAVFAALTAVWSRGPMVAGASWSGRFFGELPTIPSSSRPGAPPAAEGDGRYGWCVYEGGPEVKLAWTLGRFHPFVGAGVGLVYGQLDDTAVSTRPEVEDPRGMGRPIERSGPLRSSRSARFLLRPSLGADVVFGRASAGVQLDYAALAPPSWSARGSALPGVLVVTSGVRARF